MVGVMPPPWRPPSTSVPGLPVLDALCARILHRGVQGWLLYSAYVLKVCPNPGGRQSCTPFMAE